MAQTVAGERTPYEDIFRVPIPAELPDHPRVLCTAADIARIKADLAAGDEYTTACILSLTSNAEARLRTKVDFSGGKPGPGDFSDASALAQAYAVTGDARFGECARDLLLAFADICPTLETTRSRGRFTDSTLGEGSVAVNAATAYDFIANADFVTDEQRRHIEDDLLRVLAWECGHRCGHRDSSNWRSWALAIIASCGFAIGDRGLIDEAINGVWDPERNAYLYGIVQQLTHSVFSDGIHWERSIGYTYYTGSALMNVMIPAKNSGIDLWHAEMPGVMGPFVGSAGHEEYGPAGNRSIKAFLDAIFYYAFPGGALAQVNDSGSAQIVYHPMYELAYREYRDPKYAWLINRERQSRSTGLNGWQVWTPAGKPESELLPDAGRNGGTAFRMKTGAKDRIGLVQDVAVPADRPVEISGWVKALNMSGGSAHIRANFGDKDLFTTRVTEAGDWQQVRALLPPAPDDAPADTWRIRIHVFMENGAGEVLWDDLRVGVQGDARNYVRNADFETVSADGRKVDMWNLVHAVKDVPVGEYDLSQDATIGLTGRHENGCTLFPVGGFAVLREDPVDDQAAAVNITFGPYGSGHDHPDRLHFDLFGLGEVLCPDAGSWGYDNPMHLTWANQTIAHNTITVDEVAQEPQGRSGSIFAGERGDQRVFGVLRLFHAGENLKVVRATCDTAYEGVSLDRTLCLVDGYLLDVFSASSAQTHTYDLALHGPGEVSADANLEKLDANPFEAYGYAHLTRLRSGTPPGGLFRASFSEGDRHVSLLQVHPDGGRIILGKDPVKRLSTSSVIARREGTGATFVSVIEPYRDAPRVASVRVEQAATGLLVIVTHADGEDRFTLVESLSGTVGLEQVNADGQRIVSEIAQP